MLVKLSSKGQLVLPKTIRQDLHLERDALFHASLTDDGKIILDPVQTSALATLWGKYDDADFLAKLEIDHHAELKSGLGGSTGRLAPAGCQPASQLSDRQRGEEQQHGVHRQPIADHGPAHDV